MKVITILLFLIALGISSFSAEAQKLYGARFTSKKKYWTVGLSIGGNTYFGDIAPKNAWASTDFGELKGSTGLFVTYRFLPRLSIRGGLHYIVISGDDNNLDGNVDDSDNFGRWKRNLHFRNRMMEFSATAMIDLFPNRGVFYARPNIPIPYLLAGVGLLYHNPQAVAPSTDKLGNNLAEGGTWVDLQPLQTEGEEYGRVVLTFPVGIGARIKISNRVDVGFEAIYRITQFDYLDDVSGSFATPAQLNYDPLAIAMTDRSLEQVAVNTGQDRGDVEALVGSIIYDGYPMGNGYYPGEARGGELAPNADGTPYDSFMTFGFHANIIIPNSLTTTAKFGRRSFNSRKRYRRR